MNTGSKDGKAKGLEDGLAEGEHLGLEKGKQEEKRAIAKAMLDQGIDPETVFKETEVSGGID